MSVFRFHANRWGHGSDYINAQIYHSVVPFVAGWKDAALQNNGQRIIIWLRGGGTTYSYWSAVSVDPVVYDGVQESLPYNEPGGPSHSYKTTLDDYVNSMGVSTGDLLAGSIISTGNINVGANQVQFLSAAGGNNRIQSFGGGGPYGTWLFKSRFDHMVFDAGENPGNERSIIFKTGETERMRLDSYGNFGIGTTSPDSRLTVKGVIHSEEVKVDLNVPGPDYVFEEDYNLLSLSELEAYIRQNKHLPEIPSSKEMQENGIHLKEMNLLLLKKVEELTLYLIEANKEIDSLRKEVRELKINHSKE